MRARGARWRVADLREYDGCRLVALTPASPATGGALRRFLAPFDLIQPIERRDRIRRISAGRWRRACRDLLAAQAPPGSLRAARSASMDLLPYQLEPALAVLRGLGCRLLLADDVGLGKTVQAALVAAELRACALADRILIVAPAGLREQWAAELRDRLSLASAIVDAAAVRRSAAMLPAGINPWSTEAVVVSSIDYVKRPDVLAAVRACRWDVLIVDEAHSIANDTDRHEAIATLARRAPYVLLITATPHSGDRRAFASLCSIGRLDEDRLLVFRRTRQAVGLLQHRRVRRLHIAPSEAEARMHALLARFGRTVRRERGEPAALAFAVLQRRACSSARSLALSVARRLAALAAGDAAADVPCQFALPLNDDAGDLDQTDQPPPWSEALAFADSHRERRLLEGLHEAALAAASSGETKALALVRLLRRIREPAVVFTEYRDTLLHLRDRLVPRPMVLHGGLDRAERSAVLAAFTSGECPVLLATDAAGEGLNLHARCRLVVNFELPWNPVRLEQRIGRVDRIGQRRPVHAIHLIAKHTSEASMLRRLRARVDAARDQIDAPDPLGGETGRSPRGEPEGCTAVALASHARAEAARLAGLRPHGRLAAAGAEPDRPWLLRTRRRRTRVLLGRRTLWLFVVSQQDGCGIQLASTIVPLALPLPPARASGGRPREMAPALDAVRACLSPHAHAATDGWRAEALAVARAFGAARLRRERAIATTAPRPHGMNVQRGLFDRRADQAAEHARNARIEEAAESARRIALAERRLAGACSVRLALVLTP
ncbi:MAG: DEAD/DEAH box helicase [Acidobacteria bacterium]|nr:DEAD/DEAH box helicase [Acidobacteriota bacterium]